MRKVSTEALCSPPPQPLLLRIQGYGCKQPTFPNAIATPLSGTVHCLSDIHLSEHTPHLTQLFQTYCFHHTHHIQHLILLGDIFEYSLGDDAITPYQHTICQTLQTLTQRGIHIHWLPGNRDFLVGKRFLASFQGQSHPDPWIIEHDDILYTLTHGDALCTNDLGYQLLRILLRNPMAKRLISLTPAHWRKAVAQGLRGSARQSKPHDVNTSKSPLDRYDVTRLAVDRLRESTHTANIIHGHTHRQATHHESMGMRWVLGDWHQTGNYLILSPQQSPRFGTVRIA